MIFPEAVLVTTVLVTKEKSMKLYTLQLAVVVLNTIMSRRVSNSVAFVSLA